MFYKLIATSFLVASTGAFAYGIGQVTMPAGESRHSIGAEALGVVDNGAGIGFQGRYMLRANDSLTLDAGAGLSSGDRGNRFFAGTDYMIIPDYENQPRVSIRGQLENAEEYGKRHNIFTLAPLVSKGFYVSGYEAYPFIGIPVSLSLDSDKKTYQTAIQASLGLSGKIPADGWEQFMASVEGNVNLKDSYNSVALGMTYLIP